MTQRAPDDGGRSDENCVVVGRPAVLATNEPAPPRPRAVVVYVLPGDGTAMLGSACCPREVRAVVADAVAKRPPDAVWFRHRAWFEAEWGRRATGRVAASLSALAASSAAEFVSHPEESRRSA